MFVVGFVLAVCTNSQAFKLGSSLNISSISNMISVYSAEQEVQSLTSGQVIFLTPDHH